MQDVDNFLIDNFKKVMYWRSRHLSLARKGLIVNSHFGTSSMWTWSWKETKSIKELLRNSCWRGHLRHVRARVAMTQYCAKLNHGGISLIDPKAATKSLLTEWTVKALREVKPIFTSFLSQYRLQGARPDRKNKQCLRIGGCSSRNVYQLRHLAFGKNWRSMAKVCQKM